MKITYDNKVDAIYLSFKEGKVAKTLPLSETILTDIDKSGQIIGIEVLEASKHVENKNNSLSFGGKSFKLPSLLGK